MMRTTAFVLGGLLLVAGASAVVLADQQRQQAVAQAREELEDAEARREAARAENLELAGTLTALRVTIAEQQDRLADTEGFLK
ncbi:hypothetical protein [Microbacterium sp. CIAB417]|uniref:hypothetical protein n=1 Tax=Microbacterium sp. CIAB417 TaxID=2860287 RepID=UPI001FAB6994|nr:hypothetical protein [Microbacterium sp. CIAB417]